MLLTSIIPILAYLLALKMLDTFVLVKWNILATSVIAGVASCAIALLAAWGCSNTGVQFLAPVFEEGLKAIGVLYLMRRSKMVFVIEGLCYGAAVGAGFALLENILYTLSANDMIVATAVFRGLGTALMHMGCTALTATMLVILRDKPVAFIPALAFPMCIHALYNMFALPVYVQLFATIIGFAAIFVAISNYNERRISKWLDRSIQYDVILLGAIQEGNLANTKAGEYIASIKNQFDPVVVVDMIGYIRLYLELTIEAKSIIMLKEAGIPFERTHEQKELWQSKVTEFLTLRSNIGIVGEKVLKPIVNLTAADLRCLEN